MADDAAEVWLSQAAADLLDAGPVALYEFIWGLNGTEYGLSMPEAIDLSRRLARRLVEAGQVQIFAVEWPTYEVVDGPLAVAALDDPAAWSEGESGPLLALIPRGEVDES